MCDNESHQELEYHHHDEFFRCWHLFRHRKIGDPDFPDRCDRVVPEPSEDEEYKCPTAEECRVSKRGEHEGEEVHNRKVIIY